MHYFGFSRSTKRGPPCYRAPMFIESMWIVTLQLAPWLLLGAAVAGLLHVIMPTDFVQRQLQGWSGVFKAVGLGVPLPLCSCGVIPAGLGLKKDGASDGAAVGFLISTPQTGVDSILVSASMLGWPFALFKVVSAAVTGLVGGVIIEMLGREGAGEVSLEPANSGPAAPRRTFRSGIDHALLLLETIWRWLVLGIVVSAVITVFVPQEALVFWSQLHPAISALAVLGISIPLYVCATSSVPIAAALVAAGMPTGMALVFLMAGPATNVATMGAVLRGFGAKVLGVYLAVIVIGSVGFGFAFDALLDASAVSMKHVHHGESIAVPSACVFLALVAWFAWSDVKKFWMLRGGEGAMEESLRFHVTGMTCGGCVNRLQRVLGAVDGVANAMVTLEPGEAVVVGTTSRETIREAIEAAGFGAEDKP